ncbi:tetratricopeptide repeat protein [bacterium]|nr:tetratricopeptide repeat protein [bacterium]
MKIIILSIFTLAFSFATLAEKVNAIAEAVKKGNEFYDQENYNFAQQEYAKAQIDSPDNSDINYNQGAVFYKLKKYDKAIAAFKKSLEIPTKNIEVKCYYNIGDCLVQQGKLREALESYKRALKLDRDDKDIKYNIEYVQLKLKEIEKKKKKEKEKKEDPLNKLIKRLEILIGVQAQLNVQTKKLIETSPLVNTNQYELIDSITDIRTNEQNYVTETFEIREGFRGLRTNLPPEKLYGKQQAQPGMPGAQGMQPPGQQQVSLDQPTRELIDIYRTLAESARLLSISNTPTASTINKLTEIESKLKQIEKTTAGSGNKQFSADGRDVIGKIKYMLVNPKTTDSAEMKKISENFNSIMNKIQTELNQKTQQRMSAASGVTNGTEKTLAQKIDNAVKFLAVARDSLNYSAKFLESSWTNAPPDQKTGLEYLIKARKEFDDKNKKNKKQDKKQSDKKNKKKKDKENKNDQDKNKDKDQKQDKKQDKQKQDKKQNKQKQDKKQDNQKQNNKQNQDKKQTKQPKMDKKQVKQMLKNFKEDQRNKRKMRKQKAHAAGYVPVDKDW